MYFPGSSGFYKKQMIGNYGSSDCFRCCQSRVDSSLVSSCIYLYFTSRHGVATNG